MYCVYWVEENQPQAQMFGSNEMAHAVTYTEEKRKGGFKFVSMAYENPDMVGKQGVASPAADYHWPKRRTTALRKDVLKLVV